MSLNKLSDSDVEMLIELRNNERSLWDVTSPHALFQCTFSLEIFLLTETGRHA